MKKYVKPELFYEHFELSQQIAACQFDQTPNDADITPNLNNKDTCGFYGDAGFGPMFILQSGNDGCTTTADDYCYHGSTSGFNIFNS